MTESQEKKLAKRLAILVAEKGEAGLAELKPALESVLKDSSDSQKKRFLTLFHRYVSSELAKDTLTIESAETLTAEMREQIKTQFSKNHTRPLSVVEKVNPDLISGLRIRLGDTVYDASIAGKLETLASSIN